MRAGQSPPNLEKSVTLYRQVAAHWALWPDVILEDNVPNSTCGQGSFRTSQYTQLMPLNVQFHQPNFAVAEEGVQTGRRDWYTYAAGYSSESVIGGEAVSVLQPGFSIRVAQGLFKHPAGGESGVTDEPRNVPDQAMANVGMWFKSPYLGSAYRQQSGHRSDVGARINGQQLRVGKSGQHFSHRQVIDSASPYRTPDGLSGINLQRASPRQINDLDRVRWRTDRTGHPSEQLSWAVDEPGLQGVRDSHRLRLASDRRSARCPRTTVSGVGIPTAASAKVFQVSARDTNNRWPHRTIRILPRFAADQLPTARSGERDSYQPERR